MPTAPIVIAHRIRKKYYWLTVPGQHCLFAEGDIGAPIYWRTDAPRATTFGAPIHLAPLLMAHGTQKMEKIVRIQSFPAYEGLGRTSLHSSLSEKSSFYLPVFKISRSCRTPIGGQNF